MTDSLVLQLVNQMLLVGLAVSAPVLLTALVVGVAISIVQAATQVQEMTLTYVPKIMAVGLVIAFAGPWILHVMTNYASGLIGHLEDFVR